jgi:hypothetical protein
MAAAASCAVAEDGGGGVLGGGRDGVEVEVHARARCGGARGC